MTANLKPTSATVTGIIPRFMTSTLIDCRDSPKSPKAQAGVTLSRTLSFETAYQVLIIPKTAPSRAIPRVTASTMLTLSSRRAQRDRRSRWLEL